MDKKVFSVYLGDPDRSNHAELDLPATPWELIDALDKQMCIRDRFYTPHPEEDKRLGTVGHVRMDFGRSGNEFWHTW